MCLIVPYLHGELIQHSCNSDSDNVYLADSSSTRIDVENKNSDDVASTSNVITLDSTASTSMEEVQLITEGRSLTFSMIFYIRYF